jgi:hypothetical protein
MEKKENTKTKFPLTSTTLLDIVSAKNFLSECTKILMMTSHPAPGECPCRGARRIAWESGRVHPQT